MPCTVVVGGQFGSEGKGKVVALTAALVKEPWVVRCGGPNSGHTTSIHGKEVVLRQLPAAAGHPNAMLFVSAGCAVNEEIVLKELDMCGLPQEQVVIDPRPFSSWPRTSTLNKPLSSPLAAPLLERVQPSAVACFSEVTFVSLVTRIRFANE